METMETELTVFNQISQVLWEYKKIPTRFSISLCKIVLPHKLRYLENMLNAEVVAKAAKIRQQMEANPNIQDSDKGWPLLLSQLQADDKSAKNFAYNGYGNFRRLPNFK